MTGKLPLSGIRVLDFGHIVAGPFCVRMLADLGADVVKVETATRQGRTGARRSGPKRDNNGRTPHLYQVNRNRRSIDLNLKSEQGRETARKLIDVADVLVENFSNGVMDRLGLGYRDLAPRNPRLIYASMASFGQTGPRQSWTGMNVNLQACSGLMLATGEEGDPPIGIANSWNDYIGGLHAVVAIVGALAERRQSGKGRHLDVSQFEGSVAMLGSLLLSSAITGKAPPRHGNRSPQAAPQGAYHCAGEDQWCAISIQDDAQWLALVDALDVSSLRAPAHTTLAGRIAHHDAIDAAIETWTSKRTPDEVERDLTARGVAAAAMRRGHDLEQVEEWHRILHPLQAYDGADIKVVSLPFAFRQRKPVAVTEAPRLGATGREALRDWLDLDDTAAEALLRAEPG